MSIREQYSDRVSLPESKLPKFKALPSILSNWERFRLYFDQE